MLRLERLKRMGYTVKVHRIQIKLEYIQRVAVAAHSFVVEVAQNFIVVMLALAILQF